MTLADRIEQAEGPSMSALIEALSPFLYAAAVGFCVERDVDAAKPDQRTDRPLICFGGYAGHYAAQSRVSWADWKRLLDAAQDAGLLDQTEAIRTGANNGR